MLCFHGNGFVEGTFWQLLHTYFYCIFNPRRHKGGGGDVTPSIFLALNFCSLTDYQKIWHNCSLFVKTYFDPN